MRIIMVGAVAAGTSAAAKARRNSEDAEIIVYEKDADISYSGCGMPYHISGEVENADDLTPRNPAYFKSKYNVDIFTRHEVLAIQPDKKAVQVKNLATGQVFYDRYDRLVLATGARAFVPPIAGADREHVFSLRNIRDMKRIKDFIDTKHPQSAVIVGTGFIGLEMCESLKGLGMEVTLLEKLPQAMPGLDGDMAVYVEDHIRENGVSVLADVSIACVNPSSVILADGRELQADMVLLASGIRPNTELAAAAGAALGVTGAIRVDASMQTSLPGIYACGDCIEHTHAVTGMPVYRPLGSTANKTGRIAGDCVTGGSLRFRGILGTGIYRLFGMTVAQTGLTEREALAGGYDAAVCHNIKPGRPEYMHGKEMVIKGIADKADGRLLGVQIVGFDGVDKRIDVFAAAITFRAKAEDLFHLDLAYAPPYSTTKDPVHYTGMILDNAIRGGRPLITAQGLDQLMSTGESYTLVDARAEAQYNKNHIETAKNIPQEKLRTYAGTEDKNQPVVTYCNKGTTGNAAQNILLGRGYKRVYNLSGGIRQYTKTHKKV